MVGLDVTIPPLLSAVDFTVGFTVGAVVTDEQLQSVLSEQSGFLQ